PRPTTSSSFTITQPTAGFGQTVPSPRRARLSAARMKGASFIASIVAVGVGADAADEFAEILRLAEIAIDRGKAHIGNLIERRQRLHHQLADHVTRDVALARAFELAHDGIDDALDALALDRTL